jgi:TonB family protein
MKLICLIALMVAPMFAELKATPKDMTYPVLAAEAGIQGEVKIQMTVDPDGKVVNVQTVSGQPLLAKAAMENAKLWKWEASTSLRNLIVAISYNFKLQRNVEAMKYDSDHNIVVVTGVRPQAQP